MTKDPRRYDDIICLSRPESKRPKMPTADRAVQFAPFASLTGLDEAVNETARKVRDEMDEITP